MSTASQTQQGPGLSRGELAAGVGLNTVALMSGSNSLRMATRDTYRAIRKKPIDTRTPEERLAARIARTPKPLQRVVKPMLEHPNRLAATIGAAGMGMASTELVGDVIARRSFKHQQKANAAAKLAAAPKDKALPGVAKGLAPVRIGLQGAPMSGSTSNRGIRNAKKTQNVKPLDPVEKRNTMNATPQDIQKSYEYLGLVTVEKAFTPARLAQRGRNMALAGKMNARAIAEDAPGNARGASYNAGRKARRGAQYTRNAALAGKMNARAVAQDVPGNARGVGLRASDSARRGVQYGRNATIAGQMNARAFGQDFAQGAHDRRTLGIIGGARGQGMLTNPGLSTGSRMGYRTPEIVAGAAGTAALGAGAAGGGAYYAHNRKR